MVLCVKNYSKSIQKEDYLENSYDRTLSSNCTHTCICSMTSMQALFQMRKLVAMTVSCVWIKNANSASFISCSHLRTQPSPGVLPSEHHGLSLPKQAKLDQKQIEGLFLTRRHQLITVRKCQIVTITNL